MREKTARQAVEEQELGAVVKMVDALLYSKALATVIRDDAHTPELIQQLNRLLDDINSALEGAQRYWKYGG